MDTWALLEQALQNGKTKRVYVWGRPGIGKSRFALDRLRKRFKHVYQVTCDDDTSVQELKGHWIPKGNDFVWHDGPVTRALRQGPLCGALIVNELPRASGAVRDLMLAVLDDNSVCQIDLPNGESVRPHADFVVIATGNDSPQESLTEALVDRFDFSLELLKPNPQLVEKLNGAMPNAGTFIERSYNNVTGYISPRRMIAFITLKQTMSEEDAGQLAFGEKASAEILNALKLMGG